MSKDPENKATNAIEEHKASIREMILESVRETGSAPPMVMLFNEKGDATALPLHYAEMFLTDMKHAFKPMMHKFIDFLKEQKNFITVEAFISTEVFYSEKDASNEDIKPEDMPAPSQDPDRKEGVIFVNEKKTEIEYKVHEVIYTHDREYFTVSETPITDLVISKDNKAEQFQGNLVGIIQ
jgi:hypothetical protein